MLELWEARTPETFMPGGRTAASATSLPASFTLRRAGGADPPSARRSEIHTPTVQSNVAAGTVVLVEGFIAARPTRMLVDTGSAVTIVWEDTWKEAMPTQVLEPATCPVIAANGERLEVCGQCNVPFQVGDCQVSYPALVAKNVTQECLLGADFLEHCNCVIDL